MAERSLVGAWQVAHGRLSGSPGQRTAEFGRGAGRAVQSPGLGWRSTACCSRLRNISIHGPAREVPRTAPLDMLIRNTAIMMVFTGKNLDRSGLQYELEQSWPAV